MRERVLVISNMYPSPADRAHGSFVERCVNGLRHQGVDVETAVMGKATNIWLKVPAYLRFALHANWCLLRSRHAAVWIHQPLHSLLATLPALWLKPCTVVLNFHGHDLLPVTRRGWVLQRVLGAQFRRAARVLVPSQRFQQVFDTRFGAGRSQVFPSGGVQSCHLAPAPPLAWRGPGVLFLSRWVAGKGWREMLEVATHLQRAGSGLQLMLAGVGPDARHMHRAIAEAGLEHRVRLVHCDEAQSAALLMRRHRYFVLPTHFDESLALVNLEAMSGGCVVVSRDFAAAREYIQQGRTGYLLAGEGFAERCSALLQHLEADPSGAQRLADAGRKAAHQWSEPRVMASLPRLLGLRDATP
jgi:glycosyltransferase involved in cell wall biosynthesis